MERVRKAAAGARGRDRNARAMRRTGRRAPLSRLREHDLDGRVQRRAQEAIDAIVQGRSRVEEGARLREQMDKMREDSVNLRERLDKLEASARAKP